MSAGFLIMAAVGLLCGGMGLRLWLRQDSRLLHDYHLQAVRPEDIPAYTRLMGIGLLLIGIGILFGGTALFLLRAGWWQVPFAGGMAAGLAVMLAARLRYSRSR